MKTNIIAKSYDEDKKIITFTICKNIKDKLKNVLITSKDYNQKQKSDWVNESIEMLAENTMFSALVKYADEAPAEGYVLDKIYMTFEQRCFFAKIRNQIVVENPDIKGPQAAIIRAAINSRLFRNK